VCILKLILNFISILHDKPRVTRFQINWDNPIESMDTSTSSNTNTNEMVTTSS